MFVLIVVVFVVVLRVMSIGLKLKMMVLVCRECWGVVCGVCVSDLKGWEGFWRFFWCVLFFRECCCVRILDWLKWCVSLFEECVYDLFFVGWGLRFCVWCVWCVVWCWIGFWSCWWSWEWLIGVVVCWWVIVGCCCDWYWDVFYDWFWVGVGVVWVEDWL